MISQAHNEIEQLKLAIARAKKGFIRLVANGTSDDYTLFTQAKEELSRLENAISQNPELTQQDIETARKLLSGKIPFFTDGRAYFFTHSESREPYLSWGKYQGTPYSFSFMPQELPVNPIRRIGSAQGELTDKFINSTQY